jgi:hypothetical protein
MPTDLNAILDLSKSIAQLSRNFENGAVPPKDVQDALVLAAEKLAIATREPDENMYNIAGQVTNHTDDELNYRLCVRANDL